MGTTTKKRKKKKVKMTREERLAFNKKQKEQKKIKDEERKKKKAAMQYFNSIENIFKFSGFFSLPTEGKQFTVGRRPNCELDHCFFLENVIIICEQTMGKKDSDHLLHKEETANAIYENNSSKLEFLNFLEENFPDKFSKDSYGVSRWRIFYLYFSKEKIDFDEIDTQRYKNLKFIDIGTYNYFISMSKCIKKSFKYELLRFLGIDFGEFGSIQPGGGTPLPTRDVSIIYPDEVTGLNGGVGMVSFMMSPNELIKTSYVLRKDNWEEKIGLYQRLITEKRIKEVRKFIIDTKRTFFNNIIVGLPDTIRIYDQNDAEVKIEDIDKYQNCRMRIAEGFNAISIIDGQHRVYAYYENDVMNEEETEVASIRDKLNLLVTGIIFPENWDDISRMKFQSEIFLQINKNGKSVDKDILIHIESTKDPFSSLSIARMTLVRMNKTDPFKNMFQLSLVEKAQIKVSSIIQYALSSLVNPNDDSNGLYKYWTPSNGMKKPRVLDSETLLNEYVSFCANTLNQYFNAIKANFKEYWNDPKSLILKVISINGFIIALNHTLYLTDGPRDFNYYRSVFNSTKIDFSKEKFPYSGSRYSQFSAEVIEPIFYKQCLQNYVKMMHLTVGDVIYLINNDEIYANYTENDKFNYNGDELSLYELTSRVYGGVPIYDILGKLWVCKSTVLHDLIR